ncbi:hypothetical protein Clacol_004300 [Clathrus columnatus]|uniref:Uncharacterized protein n=1 Tax=Clathrus columnatus TaxID=1419009 RepID=A0AAV5ABI3_9AGAM|nr:hypothetical protein Clacol_004300 [Clathrus columnatus]
MAPNSLTHWKLHISTNSLPSSLNDHLLKSFNPMNNHTQATVSGPSVTVETSLSIKSTGVQSLLQNLGLDTVPHSHHQSKKEISIAFNMLHCESSQLDEIKKIYMTHQNFHQIFMDAEISQNEAKDLLRVQNLVFEELDDLGNGWSKRWSTKSQYTKHGLQQPKIWVLFQCQSGTSTEARKIKVQAKKLQKGEKTTDGEWKRKMPYDYTGCLAHLDLTYLPKSSFILRIAGILVHNNACMQKTMSWLPNVPLHLHVWQDALEQINNGASILAIRKRNQELCQLKAYHGQHDYNPEKANCRYIFLPGDSRTLYRKQAYSFGMDVQKQPADNIDNWMNPDSFLFQEELSSVIFFYQPCKHLHE